MKFFLVLALFVTASAFAQHMPHPGPHPYPGPHYPGPHYPGPHYPGPHYPGPHYPGPYPMPRPPESYCTSTQIEATIAETLKACDEKRAEFEASDATSCKITVVNLDGCKAECVQGDVPYARLRMDVNTNCRSTEAYLRKTVINYL